MNKLVYRPWVPREGMIGWFKHLSKAYGDPNGHGDKWPRAILDRVCERGEAIPIVFDSAPTYWFSSEAIFRDGRRVS